MKRHSTHIEEKSEVLCVCVFVWAVRAYGEMEVQQHSFVILVRYWRGS